MNISKIKNPEFIKKLDNTELKTLCADIRGYIIKTVSENGGYLSGNLSDVEITVALNKCFNDNDKILFNGPDMNYTNRILHGEDMLNDEHYNSLSNCLGICASRDLYHCNYNVVSVINSNSAITRYNVETLNQIGSEKRKMIIVFNDDTSIDKGIGLVDKFVSNLRNTRTYNSIKDNVKDFIRPQKGGDKIIESIHNIKSNIKKSVIDEGLFGEYNIDYIGPIDGHNINELIRAFEIAKTKDYPCVVHCITTKGKGYVYAESCTNDAFTKTMPFDVKTGKKYVEEDDNNKYCTNSVSNNLIELMKENDDIVVISADNKNETGLNSIFAKYPEKCFDGGNSIENALGFACGFSIDGKIPFIAINSSKLTDGYRILTSQIEQLCYPLIIGLVSDNDEDIKILKDIKNIVVCTASNTNELKNLIYTATLTNKPFIIRYTNSLINCKKDKNFEQIEVGKWQKVANNNIEDVVIISNGSDVSKLSKTISDNKYKYSLINSLFVNPYDEKMFNEVLKKAKHIFVFNNGLEEKLLVHANEMKTKAKIHLVDKADVKTLFKKIEKVINA